MRRSSFSAAAGPPATRARARALRRRRNVRGPERSERGDQPADGATFGARGDFDQRAFTPGLPPVRYALIFRFSATYQPNDLLRLTVSELEFTANYLTSEEKFWNNGTRGYRFELPVRVLEPKEY